MSLVSNNSPAVLAVRANLAEYSNRGLHRAEEIDSYVTCTKGEILVSFVRSKTLSFIALLTITAVSAAAADTRLADAAIGLK